MLNVVWYRLLTMRRRRGLRDPVPDEQEQDDIISDFESQANAQQTLWRTLFTCAVLLPTPAFIFLPHCRRHAKLSLLALVSTVTAAYSVYYSKVFVCRINLLLGTLIAIQGAFRNWPLGQESLLWLLPFTTAFTAVLLSYWLSQVQHEISILKGKRFELKGA